MDIKTKFCEETKRWLVSMDDGVHWSAYIQMEDCDDMNEEDSGYRVPWELHNHIVGKVYNLDQKNMNAMIRDIEALMKEKQKLQQTVLDFQSRYQGALERIEQLTMDVSHLKVQNDKYREALEFIEEGRISAASTKHDYIDQAYQEIAREALKGGE